MSKVKEDTAKVDNTAVAKPKVFERLRVTPRKYELVDLGGTPSNDTRTPAERNKDYLHPIKGAKERFKASMSNETNPLVGIERTILPSAAGAALVTTPIALAKGAGYGFGIDKLTGGWGNMVERTTGIPSEIAQYTNPGAIIGGAAGYRLDQKNLLSKFIKGDADLAWNPINKNHWIFNKEARTASNIGMAVTNRLAPFLQGVEKLPLKVAAYKTAKRTKGNASVTLSEIKGNPSDYAGASILGGGNLEGRNLVAQYIFGENPIIKRVFFNKATSNIKPISNNEAKRGFSHGDRYEQLYPGIYNRRYEMRSVVPQGRPLKFSSSEFAEYAGNNPVGKVIGKEGDMWKFNPADYAKRWNESPNAPDQVRLTKQAALMDKVGTPFILQQSNPIWIEGRSVRQAMKVGGKFTFKKSPAVKDAEKLNGKRDMRKKFVKSSRPTYKRRIRKGQVGMRFVSYVPVNNPTIDYTDITNPINPFSEYYIPTTYNTEQALVVPEREDSKSDTVEETPVVASKPIAEPVVNKPVASKVVNNTANSTWSSPYKDRSKWAADLTNAYKRAGITNDNAIRMLVSQDALESAWGRSAQGKFNFGNLTTGAKWQGDYVTGNDHDAAGNPIKQKFRSYNSMDEYAADKVQFLKRLYDFDENDDINKFVAKLTGSNKGKRRYAEARNYANTLKKVYNSYRSGGIIKYQNSGKLVGRYSDSKGEEGLLAELPEVTVIGNKNHYLANKWNSNNIQLTSEMPVRAYVNNNGRLDYTRQYNPSAGYVSGTDPLGEFVVGNAVLNKPLQLVGRATEYGLAKAGNKWARARVISKTIDKGTPSVEPLPNNVGWGPRQSIHVVHDTDAPTKLTLYNPERWDAVYEGAPEAGIWYQGKFGNPRTAANHSIPGKAEKAAKARERFAKRPYRVEGDLELERPIVTVGDVPNRAALERAADKMNADGVIFNNVYDNGYSNNQVIFSFRDNLKNGRLFKKGSRQLTTPANHSLLLDMSGVAPRPLSEFSALSNEELAKLLPDYAHPNWQGDGFKLVKYRLWNGGFDRLEKYGDIPRYSPNLRTDILNSTPKIETSATLGEQPGIGLYRQSYSVNKDVMDKLTDAQAQDVGAHELVHYMYRPSKEQEAELAYNVRQYFKRPEGRDYFRQSRATEQTARGTQIKNYYGLNEGNQDITPAMWEYARRNYVKDTGINNNMTEWLNSVDERDIIAFTKWLSKHSPAIAAPLIGGTLYDDK